MFIYLCLFTYFCIGQAYNILHLSDIHYDDKYIVGSYSNCMQGKLKLRCCTKTSIPITNDHAGYFGDQNCDSPGNLIDGTFEWIRDNIINDFDIIIYTGDDYTHHDLSQSKEGSIQSIEFITNKFIEYFPNKTVINTLGNHAGHPVDQLSPLELSDWLLDPVTDLWSHWIKDENALKTLRYGGYYKYDLNNDLSTNIQIVSLNSLYYDKNNLMIKHETDPKEQFQWFSETVKNAFNENKKLWVIGHIFPGNGQANSEFTYNYQQLVSTYSSVFLNHFWGHSHKDQFNIMYGSLLEGFGKENNTWNSNVSDITGINFIAPSIVPSNSNPAFRIYNLDNNMKVRNYNEYYMDLIDANEQMKVEYKLLYNFMDAYDVTEGTYEKQLYDLSDRMIFDNDLFQDYMTYYHSNIYSRKCREGCYDLCKATEICKIKFILEDEINTCVDEIINIIAIYDNF
jgi:sphingomyelin phosphodiesterase